MSSKKSKSRSNTPSNKHKSQQAPPATGTPVHIEQEKNLPPQTIQAYNDALEDVHTRFILNLPPEELATSDRLFFQLEQAWWYYEDIICDDMGGEGDNNADSNKSSNSQPMSYLAAIHKIKLPRFKKLQPFARKMFEISPMLSPLQSQFDELWNEFSRYRRKISTYGTILLNQDCTKVILCQDYNGKAWTFPAGKINQNERGVDAGARETYEETGFDPNCNLGQTKVMKEVNPDLPWNELKDTDGYCLRYTEGDGSGKLRTCYVCHGVPEGFPFAPVARKEVSAVQWFPIDNFPKRTFAAIPFMKGLKNWIRKNHGGGGKKRNKTPKSGKKREETPKSILKRSGNMSTGRSGSRHSTRSNDKGSRSRGSRHSTPGKNVILEHKNDDLVESGLGKVGDDNRWSEDDMFKVNEKLIGRKIDYDGNPQHFATKGFDGVDPHAFRVVQGGFMNSNETSIAESPHESKLQPIHRANDMALNDGGDDDELQPFFSEGGGAPWEVRNDSPASAPALTKTPPNTSVESEQDQEEEQEQEQEPAPPTENKDLSLEVQVEAAEKVEKIIPRKESQHLIDMRRWVEGLPKSEPSKRFGDFRFDVDAIMASMKVT